MDRVAFPERELPLRIGVAKNDVDPRAEFQAADDREFRRIERRRRYGRRGRGDQSQRGFEPLSLPLLLREFVRQSAEFSPIVGFPGGIGTRGSDLFAEQGDPPALEPHRLLEQIDQTIPVRGSLPGGRRRCRRRGTTVALRHRSQGNGDRPSDSVAFDFKTCRRSGAEGRHRLLKRGGTVDGDPVEGSYDVAGPQLRPPRGRFGENPYDPRPREKGFALDARRADGYAEPGRRSRRSGGAKPIPGQTEKNHEPDAHCRVLRFRRRGTSCRRAGIRPYNAPCFAKTETRRCSISAPSRKILVTSALPYANGPIHIGHLVEYIQTDIWARYQRLRGHDCTYVCADDAHGTPIMISARRAGVSPEELIERMHSEHLRDFSGFGIVFDEYYTTHSPENRDLATEIFLRLRERGSIVEKEIEQAYCEDDRMFLPDRFIRGSCPRCNAPDQYGDSCEVCSATYDPRDLKDPRCALCGTPPVWKTSKHYFVRLADFTEDLRRWLAEGRTQEAVTRKLEEWFRDGLRDWDITRDGPYFGFLIPGEKDKYFYVWLDAPIGYMAATRRWCDRTGRDFDGYWRRDGVEIYHFIGKDIVYFHLLFWPAMLMGAGFQTPRRVFVHGFLTVDGEKMSKSRGTFVRARTYLEHLDPQYLRYYYACKLGSGVDDIDLKLEDFVERVNSDLIGKIVNLASRAAGTLARKLDHRLGRPSDRGAKLLDDVAARAEKIASWYEGREYGRVVREIAAAADDANRFFNDAAPWETVKKDPEAARETVTAALDAFRMLVLYLKPILPKLAADAEELLAIPPLEWGDLNRRLENHAIRPYRHLMRRMEWEDVKKMIDASREEAAEAETEAEETREVVSIEEFGRIDLRVARVLEAEPIEGAKKLLRLELDVGSERRQVVAGIRAAYDPADLKGRLVVLVANLKPARLRGVESQGMILAAVGADGSIRLVAPEEGARPGDRVR